MTNATPFVTTLASSVPALENSVPPAPAATHYVLRTGQVAVSEPPERAFELFTPLGERRWAPGWDPAFHHPADGKARAGAVFSTRGEDGRETLWVIVDWQPERHRVRYARVTPGLRAGTVEVVCAPGPDGTTLATVTYELAALTHEGAADLSTWTETWYAGYLADWERQIVAALDTQAP